MVNALVPISRGKAYSSSKQQTEKAREERCEYEMLSGMRVLESFTHFWNLKGLIHEKAGTFFEKTPEVP